MLAFRLHGASNTQTPLLLKMTRKAVLESVGPGAGSLTHARRGPTRFLFVVLIRSVSCITVSPAGDLPWYRQGCLCLSRKSQPAEASQGDRGGSVPQLSVGLKALCVITWRASDTQGLDPTGFWFLQPSNQPFQVPRGAGGTRCGKQPSSVNMEGVPGTVSQVVLRMASGVLATD